jgi:short-subunit dehydrogenase
MNVIIITGASDGIGAELARQYAKAGRENVALSLAARNQERLEAVAAECRQLGAQVLAQVTDVGREPECRHLIAETVRKFGRLDTLVNNAGMSGHALLAEVSDLNWYEQLLRINLWGSIWCTHAALPHLIASKGRIVAVSSQAGLVGVPGRTAYSTSKFAMNGFFEALRVELLTHGVTVTIAYPGVVATRIRHNGFDANGQAAGVSSLDERGAMSVETCARLIRKGVEARRREILMDAKGRLTRWLKLLAPRTVDKLALAALAKDTRPS